MVLVLPGSSMLLGFGFFLRWFDLWFSWVLFWVFADRWALCFAELLLTAIVFAGFRFGWVGYCDCCFCVLVCVVFV